jgi:hypothetical protein
MVGNKEVFHNYGLGLSEYSLAYGCAYVVGKFLMLRYQTTRMKELAVVGSGIGALIMALFLAKRGCFVNLYIPSTTTYDINQADHAHGLQFWYCGDYEIKDICQHYLISKLSYDFFQNAVKLHTYQSLSMGNVYINRERIEALR